MKTAALILAAGESKRFGGPKQLADWGGRPLLEHVVDQVGGWPQVDEIYAVLGANAGRIMERVDLSSAAAVVENREWREGIASSLRAGLDALMGDREAEAALVVLADQPMVPAAAVERLFEARRRSGRPVILPLYRFRRGHPVLLDRWLWPRLIAGLEGDQGARNLFLSRPEWVEEVIFGEDAPRDIDTPEDLKRLRRLHRFRT